MSAQAKIAVKAAKNLNSWGYYAARKFAINRGVPARLVDLAIFLELTAR